MLAAGPCINATCTQLDISVNTSGLGPVTPGQQKIMLQRLAFQQMCKVSDLQAGLQLNEQLQ